MHTTLIYMAHGVEVLTHFSPHATPPLTCLGGKAFKYACLFVAPIHPSIMAYCLIKLQPIIIKEKKNARVMH